ncbi:MAG: tRNA (mo5U34)-methyltransferase [Planctomycetota bacterium]|jgi:tRNA (mo5U34)-methyltransferase
MTVGQLKPASCKVSTTAPSTEESKNIEDIRWFHKIDLGDGRVTDGRVDIATFETLYLFDQLDFQGKSVIDIGCWDGYFSFQAERRGASHVVGFDDPSYRWGGMDGFNFLRQH